MKFVLPKQNVGTLRIRSRIDIVNERRGFESLRMGWRHANADKLHTRQPRRDMGCPKGWQRPRLQPTPINRKEPMETKQTKLTEDTRFISPIPFVKNADLLTVTTINAKIVKQLPKRQIRFDEVELPNVELIGKLEHEGVIVIREDGQFKTIHQTDYNEWRFRATKSSKEAYWEYRNMPQLFTS